MIDIFKALGSMNDEQDYRDKTLQTAGLPVLSNQDSIFDVENKMQNNKERRSTSGKKPSIGTSMEKWIMLS